MKGEDPLSAADIDDETTFGEYDNHLPCISRGLGRKTRQKAKCNKSDLNSLVNFHSRLPHVCFNKTVMVAANSFRLTPRDAEQPV